ncbi:MAG: ABC transporter substrate-binding protein [Desulfobulbaceae bacterium]|nr:ABC transporter substrate-binding protein [Desulfobulbaceae bacterium]
MKAAFHVSQVLCCLLLIFFCFTCKQAPEPIRIGLAINLSGLGGTAGEHIRDGALLAVDEINGQGGINGRPLELLVRDDENSKEGVKNADESLIEAGVAAVIGHSLSSNTVTAYPIVTSSDTLLLTAYSATTELSGKDDLFLRTSLDCALFGEKTVRWLEQKQVDSVVFLMDMTNAAFVHDYANQVKKLFKGKTSEVRFHSRDRVDWPKIILDLLAPNPEAIIMLTEASMTGMALQKLRTEGYDGFKLGSVWAQTPELMRYAGKDAEGFSVITYIDPDNNRPAYISFSEQMEERFQKQATARSTRAYEIVMILADALKRTPTINSTELKKALLAGEYEFLMGHVAFDRNGDVVRPVYEVIVREGRFRNNGAL